MTKRVYFTGDVMNNDGWFRVEAVEGGNVRLVEEDGEFAESRTFIIRPEQIGGVYQGHCNPRFVSEEAYNAHRDGRRGLRRA